MDEIKVEDVVRVIPLGIEAQVSEVSEGNKLGRPTLYKVDGDKLPQQWFRADQLEKIAEQARMKV